ncbi:YIP1 family protein [Flammeovirga kamogawensis]|uniref:YIP1 family protein n=1 Tax=Flammeovirga kamogawensis TaxID=373891 RepID=A0ABX8H451_9BACT|nr:YIP1 family protein [Flammeovirga kamogawensis]MBB6464131.1 hypothetical protein [Flammeovirga kamogawensis]QWG09935.1 YIP1 family protein [Flammeovirga kamogawensis]TRX65444.1 hypothetical protein EO216_23260 [Flammeovirga kamogawensis]
MQISSILKQVWFNPRAVFNSIDKKNNLSTLIIYSLLFVGGLSYGINRAEVKSFGDTQSLSELLLMIFFMSGFGGLFSFQLLAWTINKVSCKFFRGKGTFEMTRKALVLSLVPSIPILFLFLISILIFGIEFFQSDRPTIYNSMILNIVYWVLITLITILSLWRPFIFIPALSQAQKISNLKAFFSVAISFLIPFCIGLIIAVLYLL